MYRTRAIGDLPETFDLFGARYSKVEDLRYGTNPHQAAAFYRPAVTSAALAAHRVLKSGKGGLSQTNLEDMHRAAGILKYFDRPACAVMKHCNPSGVAEGGDGADLARVYRCARDADAQAAFGSIAVFNRAVDEATAVEIMQTVVEGVAAPGFGDGALGTLGDSARYGRNRQMRVVELPDFGRLPKYVGDEGAVREVEVFEDGSIVVAAPYLSRLRTPEDLAPAVVDAGARERIASERRPDAAELADLLFAWRVVARARSNAIVIARNGVTLGIGTGQQDRVGAVELAIGKARERYRGDETLLGAVMASDGYFPFRDAIDTAARAGVAAIVQPGGSVNDAEIVAACNESQIAMVFSRERCFSHR